MTDYMYVTQVMWERAQAALRAALPVIEECVPKLSTAGTMISLRDQVRAAIHGTAQETSVEGATPPTGVITCAECEAVQPPGGTFHMSGCSSMNRRTGL